MLQKQKKIALLKHYNKSTVSYLELGSMEIPFQEISAARNSPVTYFASTILKITLNIDFVN